MHLLTRTLRLGMVGKDVEAGKRAVARRLGGDRLATLQSRPTAVRRTFGPFFVSDVKAAARSFGLDEYGVVGPALEDELWTKGCFDLYAIRLAEQYAAEHPDTPPMVSPVPAGVKVYVGGLHSTAGLAGNWALDWICAPGTPILAVEESVIRKLSGSSPADDTWEANGVYGWSTHYETERGYRYFATHLGRRAPLQVGSHVAAGQPIGYVGDQAFRPDHVHLGVTSPFGERDAKKRIQAVADAQRVTV